VAFTPKQIQYLNSAFKAGFVKRAKQLGKVALVGGGAAAIGVGAYAAKKLSQRPKKVKTPRPPRPPRTPEQHLRELENHAKTMSMLAQVDPKWRTHAWMAQNSYFDTKNRYDKEAEARKRQ
jgi:hypothetical protein